MKSKRLSRYSFPGRLSLEQWLELPKLRRRDLIWRAKCELLRCERFCANKACRRHRTCCGDDPMACNRWLWGLPRPRPKTLRHEWVRRDKLGDLCVPVADTLSFGSPCVGKPASEPAPWEPIQCGRPGEEE